MAVPYVILSDDVICHRILGSAQVLSQLPQSLNYRNRLAEIDKICQTCSGKAEGIRQRRELMQEIRLWLAGLDAGGKALLRSVLQIPEGRVGMISFFKDAGSRGGKKLERIYF